MCREIAGLPCSGHLLVDGFDLLSDRRTIQRLRAQPGLFKRRRCGANTLAQRLDLFVERDDLLGRHALGLLRLLAKLLSRLIKHRAQARSLDLLRLRRTDHRTFFVDRAHACQRGFRRRADTRQLATFRLYTLFTRCAQPLAFTDLPSTLSKAPHRCDRTAKHRTADKALEVLLAGFLVSDRQAGLQPLQQLLRALGEALGAHDAPGGFAVVRGLLTKRLLGKLLGRLLGDLHTGRTKQPPNDRHHLEGQHIECRLTDSSRGCRRAAGLCQRLASLNLPREIGTREHRARGQRAKPQRGKSCRRRRTYARSRKGSQARRRHRCDHRGGAAACKLPKFEKRRLEP